MELISPSPLVSTSYGNERFNNVSITSHNVKRCRAHYEDNLVRRAELSEGGSPVLTDQSYTDTSSDRE